MKFGSGVHIGGTCGTGSQSCRAARQKQVCCSLTTEVGLGSWSTRHQMAVEVSGVTVFLLGFHCLPPTVSECFSGEVRASGVED